MSSPSVIVALGSNLGDSREILRRAMDDLQLLSSTPLRRSSLYETAPVDCPPGSPAFINAVVVLTPKARETPETFLAHLQKLEKEFGRKPRQILNEPRPLDLDLIAFGSELRSTEHLILPHPRAHQRAFVLAPLSEIVPHYVLPRQTRNVRDLLAGLGATQTVTRLV